MLNITTFLDIRAQEPDKISLIYPSGNAQYSFSQLLKSVCKIGNGLVHLGVMPGDRVVIFLDSSPEYLISYFAIWRIGAVVVPTNIVYQEEELLFALKDAEATTLICDASCETIIKDIKEKLPLLSVIISVGGVVQKATATWDDLLTEDDWLLPYPCNLNSLCQIQYTSGTTGQPKGAMLTHGGWMAALEAEREALDIVSDDIYLGIYPMGHVGLSWAVAALRAGATYVIMERFELDRYIRLISDYSVTQLASMPPVIHALVDTKPGTEKVFGTVRRIISGGGPMHSPTWRRFQERFKIPIINAYGLSETVVLGCGTVIRPEHYQTADDFNSVGTPIGYAEVQVVDEGDPSIVLPPMEPGEIALRGPGVALGYWNRPTDTSSVFLSDGWFLTGDIGYINTHGMLVITDRKKDMIIMSGWKIYPTEVENVLIQHPKVAEIAIFGCPDDKKGEIPSAAVVPVPGESLTHEELVAYAKDRLASYKIPRNTYIVDELPRMNGWKLMRRKLRDTFCP